MTYEIAISRKTNINSHSPAGYSFRLHETDKAPTGGLAPTGPVINDTVRMAGVFTTQRAAIEAALNYVTANVAIVEDTDGASGDHTIRLVPRGASPSHGCSRRILGTRSRAGVYVAH